jgi:ABC-type bacteriocin/lantibiotic exporter with double-glycine peptidase domain
MAHVNEGLKQHRTALIEACIASAFIGALSLATSLFSMQVYDRVIPVRSEYTLIILASGVFISILIELGMKFARSHLMDYVIVGLDQRLSREIFQRLLQLPCATLKTADPYRAAASQEPLGAQGGVSQATEGASHKPHLMAIFNAL